MLAVARVPLTSQTQSHGLTRYSQSHTSSFFIGIAVLTGATGPWNPAPARLVRLRRARALVAIFFVTAPTRTINIS